MRSEEVAMRLVRTSNKWKLLEPIKVGTISLRNRIVMAPMLTCLAAPDGSVTTEAIEYYSERAKGGVGAIITEFSYVDDEESKVREHQLGVYSDHLIPGIGKLAEAIKNNGARAIFQICHAGRQTSKSVMGRRPVAPSAIPYYGEMPRELTIAEIEEIQTAFAEAASRAKQGGFDGVEVHGCHGYLISQFVSPYSNKRCDRYGGSLADRALFALETVRKLRAKVGSRFIVGYRMNGDDYVPDGITLEEVSEFAEMLEEAGVDYIHVSGGTGESLQYIVQPMYIEQACYVHLAEVVKKAVKIPVITAGSHTIETAEEALREGKADLVAFGRTLIADPDMPKKLASGLIEDIRPCIRGNEGCTSNVRRDQALRCEVNPAAGREARFKVVPVKSKKRVVVIGGGIAGIEAARLAALRGHEVILIEKGERLGGHLIEASVPEFKNQVKQLLNWSMNQLHKHKITIQLMTEATPKLVSRLHPDALIVAVGSEFIVPNMPGIDKPMVVTPDQVLLGTKPVGKRTVVVGGNLVGCETALYIKEEFRKQVIIIEMLSEILAGVNSDIKKALTNRLEKAGIEVLVGHCLKEIIDLGVACVHNKRQRVNIGADTVVLATGLRARRKLAEKFKGLAPEVRVIGDCIEARKIYNAFEEAWSTGLWI